MQSNNGNIISTDPDEITSVILKDVAGYITEKYGQNLAHSKYFNLQRLPFLLGGQFLIAKEARSAGYIIEDCEMCGCFDRQLSFCNYYKQALIFESNHFYYHKALCPALVVNRA